MSFTACKSLSSFKTPFDINYESKAYLVSSNDSFFTWRRSKPLFQLQNVSYITHVVNLTIKTNYKQLETRWLETRHRHDSTARRHIEFVPGPRFSRPAAYHTDACSAAFRLQTTLQTNFIRHTFGSFTLRMVRIAFIHPDLGIGGAERLVVDAGLALKSRGHKVHFFTSHHEKSHCFEETRNGSLQVTAVGDWLPRNCFGYFYAFWAYVRMIYVSLYLVFFSSWRMDVVFCDQVSVCIPVLKLSKARIVFYCHFPDLLLTQRKSLLKRIYRAPLDWLEEVTTGELPTSTCIWVKGRVGGGGGHRSTVL